MNFLNKITSLYSTLFVSVCGWIGTIGFLVYWYPYLKQRDYFFVTATGLVFITTCAFFFVCFAISIILYTLENIFSWQINNKLILKNIFLKILILVGLLLAILPLAFIAYIIISGLF